MKARRIEMEELERLQKEREERIANGEDPDSILATLIDGTFDQDTGGDTTTPRLNDDSANGGATAGQGRAILPPSVEPPTAGEFLDELDFRGGSLEEPSAKRIKTETEEGPSSEQAI